MKKRWLNFNGTYSFGDLPTITDFLPPAVYELRWDDGPNKQFVLSKICDKFELPKKVYGLETDFINRVLNTFNKHQKNFGVLFKGIKGTGKTITGKIISNKLNLPVILVNKAYSDMANFINSIDQDVIVMFDEFEKIYSLNRYRNDDDDTQNVTNLLTLMDGVFTSKHKRLFILTTNEEWMPDTILARPSRIRYIKDFSKMSTKSVMEILEDTIENLDLLPQLLEFIKGLDVITVDIVKSLVEEVNIYNTADAGLFDIFNIKKLEDCVQIYLIDSKTKKETILADKVPITKVRPNYNIYDSTEENEYVCRIKSVDKINQELVLYRFAGTSGSETEKTKKAYYREVLKHNPMYY